MAYEPIKDDTKEQYVKIWTHYSVAHFTQSQLGKLFSCGVDTVANAIKWASENRAQFKPGVLLEAAKEAVEAKLRELGNDLVRIREKEPVNWNAVIGVEKLIVENRQLLWKLQAVIQDKSIVTVNNVIDNSRVLNARDEMLEELSDGERQQIASRIREVLNRPIGVQERTDGVALVDGTPAV